MLRFFLIIVLVLFSFFGFAQLKPYTDTFRGRVIDGNTKQAIPYAIIRIQRSAAYVMSNHNGDFELKIPYSFWNKKQIFFEVKSAKYRPNLFRIETKKKKKEDVFIIRMNKK